MLSGKTILKKASRGGELESMPSFLLNHIVHQYHQILQSRLRSTGISSLQMRIILSLHAHGRLTVGELCNYAIAEQPTMSRALDSMEAQGLATRKQSEADSRLRVVTLTEQGEKLHDRIQPVILGINAGMVDGLSEEASAQLIRQLGVMLVNLGRL